MKYNFKRKKIPNIRSDFNNVLKCLNKISNFDLANKLVSLSERDWLEDLKENSIFLDKNINSEKNKNANNENTNSNSINNNFKNTLNEYIKERISIQEDFNWLLWGLGIGFWNVLIQKTRKNFENFGNINRIIPNINDISKWREGFIYNGVYILLLDKVDNN